MNLKEEINKCSYPAHQVAGLFPNDQVCNKKDVIHIAEAYAKEKAWETWNALDPNEEHYRTKETAAEEKLNFEIWWEENK